MEYSFQYFPKLRVIDTKSIIDKIIKESIYVELPIPHGERFKHFQKLSEIDEELRRNISLNDYTIPSELILFLTNVYSSDRFDNLKETSINNSNYYFILREKGFYIREDYLSSGEFFVINLYKMVQQKCKLIVIDEIDISLDASAQVNLINELRNFCTSYQVNIVFTTHSLAIMKMLNDSELYYMENTSAGVAIRNASYNYVKSILFGFTGWDKYILTEDIMLENYLVDLISRDSRPIFFKYKIIYIGGGTNTVNLMERNSLDHFFSSPENVISVLDADKKDEIEKDAVLFTPFQSVEKQLFHHYQNGDLSTELTFTKEPVNAKELYNSIIEKRYMSDKEIFTFINKNNSDEVETFREKLNDFLNA